MFLRSIFLICLTFSLVSSVVHSIPVSVFAMPDNSYDAISNFLYNTENNLSIAAYTITSNDIASMLYSLRMKNISISVVIDKSPAGGIPVNEKTILCNLYNLGATVKLYDKPFRYHHAKYIIRDNKDVLVSTDNFVYDSYPVSIDPGTVYNRGWGAIVYNANASLDFIRVFNNDLNTSVSFSCAGSITTTTTTTIINTNIVVVDVARVETVFAPDNSLASIISFINASSRILYFEELYIYKNFSKNQNPLLDIIADKAKQGVDVRVLLNGYKYESEENNETIQYLSAFNVSAQLHEGKLLHIKGIISDDNVMISSINLNDNSILRNREAGVILYGAADYYKNLFLKDWKEAQSFDQLTGFATDISSYHLELAFLSIGLVVVVAFLLKNNAFR